MNDEPKKQEPEIVPPGPKVEPERPGPEIPSDKDVPERESHIRAANGARHGTNFIVMILPLLSGGGGGGSEEDSVEILFGLLRHIRGGRTPDSAARC